MTLARALDIVDQHQLWRLGKAPYDVEYAPMPCTPGELTQALQLVVDAARAALPAPPSATG